MRSKGLFVVAVSGLAAGALAQFTHIETFEDHQNPAGWTYGSPFGHIQASGGNPGAFWRDNGLDTFAPMPRTGWGVPSPFTGNYQQNQVSSVGIDLILFHVDFSAGGRPLSVLLISDAGTPQDFDDDYAAFFMGSENIPLVGEGWKSYDFDVPSQSSQLPAGWGWLEFGPNSAPNWNALITDVSQLSFFYGDPEMFFIFQMWDVGMDNPRITLVPEPGTIAAVAVGLLALLRRRRSVCRHK